MSQEGGRNQGPDRGGTQGQREGEKGNILNDLVWVGGFNGREGLDCTGLVRNSPCPRPLPQDSVVSLGWGQQLSEDPRGQELLRRAQP